MPVQMPAAARKLRPRRPAVGRPVPEPDTLTGGSAPPRNRRSLLPEREDRVDERGAPRGQRAGGGRSSGEQQRGTAEDGRVERLHLIEKAAHRERQERSHAEPHRDARRGGYHSAAQDGAHHVGAVRAERDRNSYFAAALL